MFLKKLPVSREHGPGGSVRDQVVRQWFMRFRRDDGSLEKQEARGGSPILDDQYLETLCEQNP